MSTNVKYQLMDFIHSDEMLPVFYYHFESFNNDKDNFEQLLFFTEVKALRLWATLSIANLYIKDRNEFTEIIEYVKQDLFNKTADEALEFIFNRHISYNKYGQALESLTKVGYEFAENTKLPHLKEESVQMVKAFIGKASEIYREYY
ncbi:hypothetical protein [Planococcus wigleyi]|uniref:Uncharacterized protein n=1 Tax=Planococcus wigleyi TaxID=2762216 RepID=A0ABR8WA30_9BACL|nr:hypothetical protein [Planococcus wigleyi]MBD8013864.1 hypothetical protein [Planococcus wigleyi]